MNILDQEFDIDKYLKEVLKISEQAYINIIQKTANLPLDQRYNIIAREVLRTEQEIKNYFNKDPKYIDAVKKYLTNYDLLNIENEKIFNKQDINIKSQLRNMTEGQRLIMNSVIDGLSANGMSGAFIKPLTNILSSNAIVGTGFKDVKKYLSERINSNEGRRYINQVTTDSLRKYDGTIKTIVAQEWKLNCIKYIGSVIKDSRPQCKRWHNMGTIKKEDLAKEIRWAEKYGSGMIEGTTPDNFLINVGGYNCRHTAIPFRCK
jgi:hypothetical protein